MASSKRCSEDLANVSHRKRLVCTKNCNITYHTNFCGEAEPVIFLLCAFPFTWEYDSAKMILIDEKVFEVD